MISIIITSYKEPKTIGKAIKSIIENKIQENYEIIIAAPDKETLDVARKYSKTNKNIRIIRDNGLGKPSALNLAIRKSKGGILVLTDGDVYVENNSINFLLNYFRNKNIGAVSGHPISLNSKNTLYGFWAYVLTNIANETRIKSLQKEKRIFCSGYFFAIRKSLFPKLPEGVLSEDGFISNHVYESGFNIEYSKEAKVYVKYPDNFSDWIKQKKRSAGGYNQIKKMVGVEIRSFKSESLGAFKLLKYVSNIKEFMWLICLYFSRLYLWFVIYKDINLIKKNHKHIWIRVESTK